MAGGRREAPSRRVAADVELPLNPLLRSVSAAASPLAEAPTTTTTMRRIATSELSPTTGSPTPDTGLRRCARQHRGPRRARC
jgi:hypothetical protein